MLEFGVYALGQGAGSVPGPFFPVYSNRRGGGEIVKVEQIPQAGPVSSVTAGRWGKAVVGDAQFFELLLKLPVFRKSALHGNPGEVNAGW